MKLSPGLVLTAIALDLCITGFLAFWLYSLDQTTVSHRTTIIKANNDYKIEMLCKGLLPDRASACLKLSIHERYKYDALDNPRPGEDFKWTR